MVISRAHRLGTRLAGTVEERLLSIRQCAPGAPMFPRYFMAVVKPFRALRPKPELASKICELPYDVMSSDEAREIARDNPFSFLHVSKPEIDLPADIDLYSPQVYEKGRQNFDRLIAQGALVQDAKASFYLYRQIMGSHSQVGLVAAASCQEYLDGIIKKARTHPRG